MCTVVKEIKDAGRLEGKLEEKKEIILSMLAENISDELIAKICDVSLEFIEEIRKEL